MPNDKTQELRQSDHIDCKFSTKNCERDAVDICIQCREPFCPDHVSIVDSSFCQDCLSPKDAEVKKEPLVDSDGVTHAGVHIIPVGSAFKTTAQRICEMTDEQLSSYIEDKKVKVHDAEVALDKHRIDLSVAVLQKEELADAERKKLRKAKPIAAVAAAAGNGSSPNDKAKKTIEVLTKLAEAMGLKLDTPDKVAKFATMLSNANKGKKG